MTKTRLAWILTGLAVLVAVVLILLLPRLHDLAVGRARIEELPTGQAISVETRAERFGVQKGDAFSYLVEVLYDPDQVFEIDRASLDKNVNLEPFEVRGIKETDFDLDSGTHVYQREYELQLISGEVEHLYRFPTIVVRYKPRDIEGYVEKAVVPELIYVASRLPYDVSQFELGHGPIYPLKGEPIRPLKGEIEDASQNRLPWILWVLGGFLAALAVANLKLRNILRWKETAEPTMKIESGDVLYQAYRSLHGNVATDIEPKRLLHQMDHVLRLILSRKENVGWLEEPNLDLLSSGIREPVISLSQKCHKAHAPEIVERKEVEEALRQLEEILSFYFGEGEMAVWRS